MPGPGHFGPRGFLTEEEKKNKPEVSKELILRILSYLKPYWWQLLMVFITILVSAVLGLLPSIIIGRVVDEALVGKNMTLLIRLLLMVTSLLLRPSMPRPMTSPVLQWVKLIISLSARLAVTHG